MRLNQNKIDDAIECIANELESSKEIAKTHFYNGDAVLVEYRNEIVLLFVNRGDYKNNYNVFAYWLDRLAKMSDNELNNFLKRV